MKKISGAFAFVLMMAAVIVAPTNAEPYFAVREGMDCSSCHVNPTGGGLRNAFGNVYSQNQLPAMPLSAVSGEPDTTWTGEVFERFNVGGNARYSARQFDVDDQDDNTNLAVDRASLYLNAQVTEAVSLYIDQQVAPGGSLNREAWAKVQIGNWYAKAGQLFLPFGWRLEDDSAFVRQVTGVNFNTPDNGVELGYLNNGWSAQLSVTNGTAGAAEVDDGKQASLRLAHFQRNWQVGVSANHNNTDTGERTMAGVFVGVNTGPVTWLAEWDRIDDDFVSISGEQDLALVEANYLVAQGHNLKFTAEARQFDDDREDRNRYSFVWEYFPLPYTQFRVGARQLDSDDDTPALNAEEAFAQLHVFF